MGNSDLSYSAQDKNVLGPVSWSPGFDLVLSEWLWHGQRLGAIGRGVAWWIGDWVNYGNTCFGEKYLRASRVTGYDVQSLMNMAYVASRFSISRRREKLSWSHHAEIAALSVDDQERWLDAADEQRLSVRRLRVELRKWRGSRSAAAGGGTEPAVRAVAAGGEEPAAGTPEEHLVCPNCGHFVEARNG